MTELISQGRPASSPIWYFWHKLRGEDLVCKILMQCGIKISNIKVSQLTFEDLVQLSPKSEKEIITILRDHGIVIEKVIAMPTLDFFKKSLHDMHKMIGFGYAVSVGLQENSVTCYTSSLAKVCNSKKSKSARPVSLSTNEAYQNYLKNIQHLYSFYEQMLSVDDTWKRVLFHCLYDAYLLGADFLRIVHSFDTCEYSFSAGGRMYSGKIDHRVVKGLVNLGKEHSGRTDKIYRLIFPLGDGSCFVDRSGCSTHIVVHFSEKTKKCKVIPEASTNVASNERKVPHVLLIDDDEKFLSFVKRGIAALGYRVSISVSANDALHMYLNSTLGIDLVVTDLHMPQVNGVELIRTIKKYDKNLPIIALTSDENTDSEISLVKAGSNVVMHKQDDPQLLFIWMEKLLGKEFNLDKVGV